MIASKKYSWLLLLGLIAFLYFNSSKQQTTEEVTEAPVEEIIEPVFPYGFSTDSLIEINDKVKRNEHLSSILLRYNVEYSTIHEMVEQSSGIFDFRQFRVGKPYKVFCTNDSSENVRCFVYEKNPLEYVVFDLRDSVMVFEGKKDVEVRVDSIAGVINSSLYLTLMEQGVKPYLAMALSEVFAWQIDFFRINKGDEFKVIYETNYVEGEPIGMGNIQAAWFGHKEIDFYAFRFEQDSISDYYDEQGQSLRKAFLKAPLKFSRISSRFTRKRFHPILKRYKPHLGVDYAAPRGTPIMAIGDGYVTHAGYTGGNGNYVKIKHNSIYTTGYLHMTKRAKGISKGSAVKQGQVIGYVGSTGLATGPHLCFRFYKNGEQVNPLTVEVPPSEPIPGGYMEAYMNCRDEWMQALGSIKSKSTEAEKVLSMK